MTSLWYIVGFAFAGVSFVFLEYFGLTSTHDRPALTQLENLPITPALPAAPESADPTVVEPSPQTVVNTGSDTATP